MNCQRLKNYLFSFLIVLVAVQCQPKVEPFAKISCQYMGETDGIEAHLSKVEHGKKVKVATSKISKSGLFYFTCAVDDPGLYVVNLVHTRSGRGVIKDHDLNRFYLEKGVSVDIELQEDKYNLVHTNCEKNQLLSEWNQKVDTLYTYSHGFGYTNLNYDDFFPVLPDFLNMGNDFKKQIHTKDTGFNELLNLLVATDMNYSLLNFLNTPREKHPKVSQIPACYEEIRAKGAPTSIRLLELPNGMRYIQTFGGFSVVDFQFDPSKILELDQLMINAIKNDTLKGYLAVGRQGRFRAYDDSYSAFKEMVTPYILTPYLKNKVKFFEKTIKVFEKGTPASDFAGTTIEGKEIKLSDLKGQVVYVDVWATWCGPCKEEIPHLKTLEKKFHGKPVTFLSISVDKPKDREKWEKYVTDNELKGVQIMADKAFESDVTKLYDIYAIPRFLLFDKEGKIVTIDAPRPSDPKTEELLNSLL